MALDKPYGNIIISGQVRDGEITLTDSINRLHRQCLDTKERITRCALYGLGWSPPDKSVNPFIRKVIVLLLKLSDRLP